VNTRRFDLTSHFQGGDHDVISRRKVLLSGECTRSVCRARMPRKMRSKLLLLMYVCWEFDTGRPWDAFPTPRRAFKWPGSISQ